MLATSVGPFCPLPASLSLLTQHAAYPTVANLLGLRTLLRRDPANYDRGFVAAAAAADPFFPGKVPHEDAAAVGSSSDDGGRGSPMNLCTAIRGRQFADAPPTPAWPLYPANEPFHGVDPVAVHGVGVFQRLLALMSRRASALDSMQRRYAQQPLFGGQYPDDSSELASLNVSRQQKLHVDRSEAYASEQYDYTQSQPQTG